MLFTSSSKLLILHFVKILDTISSARNGGGCDCLKIIIVYSYLNPALTGMITGMSFALQYCGGRQNFCEFSTNFKVRCSTLTVSEGKPYAKDQENCSGL
jgi:hypothetical protein